MIPFIGKPGETVTEDSPVHATCGNRGLIPWALAWTLALA
jgi:hypothetical protein